MMSKPVFRVPWRTVVYVGGVPAWLVGNLLLWLTTDVSIGWRMVTLVLPVIVALFDIGHRKGWLAYETEPQPPTEWACSQCGAMRPLSKLVECDGLICREHILRPVEDEHQDLIGADTYTDYGDTVRLSAVPRDAA